MPTAYKTGSMVASSGNLTDVDTVARNTPGASCEGNDSFGAAAEFVYLKGAANMIAGSVVTYDEAGLSELVVTGAVGPVAVALAPVLAANWGWFAVRGTFQVDGVANIADNKSLGFETTAGKVGDGFATGDGIRGMISRGATTAAALVYAQLLYPTVGVPDAVV